MQSCLIIHVTNTLKATHHFAPADLVFESIARTESANRSFGIHSKLLFEAHSAALSLAGGSSGDNVMLFEIGQGVAL